MRVASALSEALTRGDTHAEPLAVEGDRFEFVDTLRRMQPDLVINLCESLAADSRGEMVVPCLLDMLGLPYTGSSALSLGLALHKHKAKELLRARGISTPPFAVVERVEDLRAVALPYPLIVKPAREDASAGRGLRLGGGGSGGAGSRRGGGAAHLPAARAGGAVHRRPGDLRPHAGQRAASHPAADGDPLRQGLREPAAHRLL